MMIRNRWARNSWILVAACALVGCGGGGAGTPASGSKSTIPTAATKTHTAAHLAALGQGALSINFAGFGPNATNHHGQVIFAPMLGVYVNSTVAPDGLNETLTLDLAGTQPAGQIQYIAEDVGVSFAGTISLTAGRYAGLTGNYLQSVVSGGFSGNEQYNLPNVATTSGEFSLTQNASGNTVGTEQFAVALASGYTQNEQIVIADNASEAFTTTDVNNYKGDFNFTSDGSGTGTIKGSDAGLPATVTWDTSGTGQVKFADGSTVALAFWQMQTT